MCSTSNASRVTVWSFSSSPTRPRQKSDETTSVGRKCRAANVDLPEPDTPTRTTSDSFGDRDRSSSAEHRHLRRRPDLRVVGPDGQEPHPVAVALAPRRRPTPANSARVHSKRWSRWRSWPAGSASNRTLYSTFGVVTTTVARSRVRRTPRARARRGAAVEVLDHLHQHGRVEALEPRVAVGERALEQRRRRSRWRGDISSRCSRRSAASSAPTDTSTPTIRSSARLLEQRRAGASRRRSRGRATVRAPADAEHRQHRADPLVRAGSPAARPVVLARRRPARRGIGRRRPPTSRASASRVSDPPVPEVAARDQLALGMIARASRRPWRAACRSRSRSTQ